MIVVARSVRSLEQGAGGLSGPRPARVRGHAEQRGPAGAVLDRDQRVNPLQHHGVHGHEVHGQDGLGLGGEELAPGRARPAGCGIDPGLVQDLPHGAGGETVAEADQFALPAPVSPTRVLGRQADDELLDRRCGRGTFGPAACGVVPRPGEQPAMPGQDRGRRDPGKPRPSGGVAAAEIRRPATSGRRACSGPGQVVGAARCSPGARPAARRPCSGLAAPIQL